MGTGDLVSVRSRATFSLCTSKWRPIMPAAIWNVHAHWQLSTSALTEFAAGISISPRQRAGLVSVAVQTVLLRPLYPEAPRAMDVLTQRGYTHILIPPHSCTFEG